MWKQKVSQVLSGVGVNAEFHLKTVFRKDVLLDVSTFSRILAKPLDGPTHFPPWFMLVLPCSFLLDSFVSLVFHNNYAVCNCYVKCSASSCSGSLLVDQRSMHYWNQEFECWFDYTQFPFKPIFERKLHHRSTLLGDPGDSQCPAIIQLRWKNNR